jgi:hypothetical protein
VLATALTLALLMSATASTAQFRYGWFKTPSGNIQCGWGYTPGTASGAFVQCGIKSGLKPPPPRRGPDCSVPNRITLNVTGRTRVAKSICPGEDEGDAGPFAGGPTTRTLDYGQRWSGGGLSCTSTFKGLTCRNEAKHGFFLSRARWRSF